jgi:hypothetical protein
MTNPSVLVTRTSPLAFPGVDGVKLIERSQGAPGGSSFFAQSRTTANGGSVCAAPTDRDSFVVLTMRMLFTDADPPIGCRSKPIGVSRSIREEYLIRDPIRNVAMFNA